MSAEGVIYLDSSAIVKLVVREPESWASRRVREVLSRIDLVRIDGKVLTMAASMEPSSLRTLDAIHLATASLFGTTLTGIVCYDRRMSQAAEARRWTVVAPA